MIEQPKNKINSSQVMNSMHVTFGKDKKNK